MARQKKATAEVAEMPKKGRKPVPENETREQKLARLADARVTKAIRYISLCGNLAAYRPTGDDITCIMGALAEACSNVHNRLEGTRRDSITFRLHKS